MSKFFRGLRNKIRESLKNSDLENIKYKPKSWLVETHSGRFNKVVGGGKKGFRAVVNFLKIKF